MWRYCMVGTFRGEANNSLNTKSHLKHFWFFQMWESFKCERYIYKCELFKCEKSNLIPGGCLVVVRRWWCHSSEKIVLLTTEERIIEIKTRGSSLILKFLFEHSWLNCVSWVSHIFGMNFVLNTWETQIIVSVTNQCWIFWYLVPESNIIVLQ